MDFTPPIIFFSVLLLVFSGIAIWGISVARKAHNTKHWHTTSGTITESYVKGRTDWEHDTTYGAQIQYKYTTNECEHKSHSIYPGGRYESGNIKTFEKLAAQYPKGKTVTVFYNPDDPSESILCRCVLWWAYSPLILGIMGIGFSGLMLYAWIYI